MKRAVRSWKFWAIAAITLAIGGTLMPLMVFGRGEGTLTVTPYADVVRFEALGVASLQVQIYDLSGNLLWDSGVVSGGVVDWDRTDEYGERLAYGTYLYLVQGWDPTGALKLKRTGKLSLLPGDRLQLQVAPPAEPGITLPSLAEVNPKWTCPDSFLDIINSNGAALLRLKGNDVGYGSGDIQIYDGGTLIGRILASGNFGYVGFIGWGTEFRVFTRNAAGTSSVERLRITGDVDTAIAAFLNSNVGIGTAAPLSDANLTIDASAPGEGIFTIGCALHDLRAAEGDLDLEGYDGITFKTGSAYDVAGVIDTDQNWGLGTDTPGAKLNVYLGDSNTACDSVWNIELCWTVKLLIGRESIYES